MLIRVINDLPLSPGLEAAAHGRMPLEAVVETDLDVPMLTTVTLNLGGPNAGLLFDGDELRGFVNVYVNNEDIRYLEDLATPVAPNDEVSIIPAVAGG